MPSTVAAEISVLSDFLDRLVPAASILLADVRFEDADDFAFMGLCFLAKQIDHAESIQVLRPRRDIILIARSMIEGLCQLLWAATDMPTRSSRWRRFAAIHDWRIAQSEQGVPMSDDVRARIAHYLSLYGDDFLTKRARKAKTEGRELPSDPYVDTWRGYVTFREIFETVQAEALYHNVYKQFADWHHWGVSGLGGAIMRDNTGITYTALNERDTACALAVAFYSLAQVAILMGEYLHLDGTSEIVQMREQCIHAGGG